MTLSALRGGDYPELDSKPRKRFWLARQAGALLLRTFVIGTILMSTLCNNPDEAAAGFIYIGNQEFQRESGDTARRIVRDNIIIENFPRNIKMQTSIFDSLGLFQRKWARSGLQDNVRAIRASNPINVFRFEKIKRFWLHIWAEPAVSLGDKLFSGGISAIADGWGYREDIYSRSILNFGGVDSGEIHICPLLGDKHVLTNAIGLHGSSNLLFCLLVSVSSENSSGYSSARSDNTEHSDESIIRFFMSPVALFGGAMFFLFGILAYIYGTLRDNCLLAYIGGALIMVGTSCIVGWVVDRIIQN